MFADDTTIFCIGKELEDVIDNLNRASGELHEWCLKNRLTVHPEKTEATIIKANGFTGPLRPILFGETVIKYVTHSVCLGITIDNKLSWTKHHEKVVKSFSSKIKELKRFRYLPKHVQEDIYYKRVIPAVTYCIAIWGTASPSHLEELETLQAKTAKFIFNIKEKCLDEDLLTKAKWKPLSYIYKRRLLTWMHQIYYETCPLPIVVNFTKTTSRPSNPLQFNIPRYKREIGRNSLSPDIMNETINPCNAAEELEFRAKAFEFNERCVFEIVSGKEGASTNTARETEMRKVVIIGDSQLRKIDGEKLSNDRQRVIVKAMPGSKVGKMKNVDIEADSNVVIIHAGTCNIKKQTNPENLADEIVSTLCEVKRKIPKSQVAFSSILKRNDDLELNAKVIKTRKKNYSLADWTL
eukprot:gene8603-9531_t